MSAGGTIGANRGRSSSASGSSRGGGNIETPVGLGGLFAGGVPTLKSRGGIGTGRENNKALAVPPELPGARPRATSAVNSTNRSNPNAPPPPNRNSQPIQRSQSPQPQKPRQVLPTNIIDNQRSLTAVLPTNGTHNIPRNPLGQLIQSVAFAPQEPPTTEGRWSFHPSSDFPAPRPFINSEKLYPSGASSGSSIPLELSSLSIQANPQRAPPPPPGVGRKR
ncbi:6504_t:CDS:2 [Ambispora gerdemannii]|uniref:6504_t:CDS:1 n=1 Tax=Ambispora gerdemannii TaxID=144530 RepID=A0A9N8W2U6_9GLOM|nr:6504_t:CDS:2 [Ambispora gerdemannii]